MKINMILNERDGVMHSDTMEKRCKLSGCKVEEVIEPPEARKAAT
jgi:hypothetical protein